MHSVLVLNINLDPFFPKPLNCPCSFQDLAKPLRCEITILKPKGLFYSLSSFISLYVPLDYFYKK